MKRIKICVSLENSQQDKPTINKRKKAHLLHDFMPHMCTHLHQLP